MALLQDAGGRRGKRASCGHLVDARTVRGMIPRAGDAQSRSRSCPPPSWHGPAGGKTHWPVSSPRSWGLHTVPARQFTRVCSMWMSRQGEQKEEDLAGGRSSRSSRRCCYLHYFHILQNKEQEAASNSGELGVRPVPGLSQSRGWSRQGAAPRTQRISDLMERTASSLSVKPEEEGHQDSPLVTVSRSSSGDSAESPSSSSADRTD